MLRASAVVSVLMPPDDLVDERRPLPFHCPRCHAALTFGGNRTEEDARGRPLLVQRYACSLHGVFRFSREHPMVPEARCGVRRARVRAYCVAAAGRSAKNMSCRSGSPSCSACSGWWCRGRTSPPHPCPQLGRTVQALLIEIVHLTPSGDQFAVVYGHLSPLDVVTGATVSDRTRVGLSGNTGCSGTPHLHFGVFRNVSGDYRVLDPYGWHASGADPWERDARGTINRWLWKPGEAPALR
jgi:hypothetical protein